MEKAFILINSITGLQELVIEKMRSLSFVKEIHKLYGVYDILLKVEENDHLKLKDVVTNSIRKMEGVGSTLTMIVI